MGKINPTPATFRGLTRPPPRPCTSLLQEPRTAHEKRNLNVLEEDMKTLPPRPRGRLTTTTWDTNVSMETYMNRRPLGPKPISDSSWPRWGTPPHPEHSDVPGGRGTTAGGPGLSGSPTTSSCSPRPSTEAEHSSRCRADTKLDRGPFPPAAVSLVEKETMGGPTMQGDRMVRDSYGDEGQPNMPEGKHQWLEVCRAKMTTENSGCKTNLSVCLSLK